MFECVYTTTREYTFHHKHPQICSAIWELITMFEKCHLVELCFIFYAAGLGRDLVNIGLEDPGNQEPISSV